jgi:hypothetical protein
MKWPASGNTCSAYFPVTVSQPTINKVTKATRK